MCNATAMRAFQVEMLERPLPAWVILWFSGSQEAKEAIHIRRLDPNLNRNIGKMSTPHCFDHLIGAKPKHPRVGLLSQAPHPVDEVAPPSQIPGLNLTQFNEIGTFRPNPHQFLPRQSTRACRAKALHN